MEKMFGGDLALFLAFFVPGFVALRMYDLLVPSERRDFSRAVFDAVALSALNFALLWPAVALILAGDFQARYPILYVVSVFTVLLIAPAIWPVLWVKAILRSEFLSKHLVHPHDKAWDYVFSRKKPFWIILHLKDTRRIGGRFGPNSFASSNPAEPQIFLEEVWNLDANGAFTSPVDRSRGILVLEEDLLAVEFFQYDSNEEV